MEEESWRRNHGGGIMVEESWRRRNHGGGIMEEESWRRNHGGIMEEESTRRHVFLFNKKTRRGISIYIYIYIHDIYPIGLAPPTDSSLGSPFGFSPNYLVSRVPPNY